MQADPDRRLAAGRAALTRGDWQEARDAFEGVVADSERPEALEGLGWALWWMDEVQPSFEVRERAYRAYLGRGDACSAARVATALGLDIYDYQGEAVTSGWLQRARRHLEGLPAGPEHGWMELWQGHFDRLARGDAVSARGCAERAARIARNLGLKDLEMLALGLEGHVLVTEGEVDEGMKRLDEATAAALAGEISDLDAAGAACCFLMHACEQVRDLDRAMQWADRVAEFSRRWRIRPLYAICRVHYAAVLVSRGEWARAEEDLQQVLSEISSDMGPARAEATLHLAELRRRQGRRDEAVRLFGEVEGFSLALIGRGLMALEDGDGKTALALFERALRRAAEDNWIIRTTALKHLARAQVKLGRRDEAERTLETLQGLADLVRTDYVRATARQAAGCWMSEHGETGAARHAFEDAVDLFERCRAPFEAHGARLDLARLLAREDSDLASSEARTAFEGFTKLGATREAERAKALTPATADDDAARGPLTRREAEVLSLVADGLGDKEIASKLHLSEHTVHRHISNVLLKLEAPSRAAAVAQAVRRGLI